MIKEFKKIDADSAEVNKVQSNLEQFFRPFVLSEIIDGVLIKDVALVTGSDNVVSHKLGKKPQGWIVVRRRANSVVWDTQDANSFPESTLVLQASANVTIDLWIF